MKVWENSKKLCGNTRLGLLLPQHFLFSQTSTGVSITRQKHRKCFLLIFLNKPIYHQAKCKKLFVNNLKWNVLISSRYYLLINFFRSAAARLIFFHETDQNVWVMDFWCYRVQKYVDFSLSFYLVPVCQQLKILQVMEILAHLHRPCQAFTKYSS